MMTRRNAIASLAAFLTSARALRAQQEQDQPKVFKSEVKVVTVLATVRTKKGDIVRDLKQEDFLIEEEGRPQTIRYFSHETDLPLTLGLEVDTSGSQRRLISEEVSASYKFMDRVLREGTDKSFLIHFDFDSELLQDITSKKKEMQRALDELGTMDFNNRQRPQLNRPGQGGSGGGTGGGGYPGGRGGRRGGGSGGGGGGGTTLYDAVLLGSEDIMSHEKGRKSIILLTDGVDNGSKVSLPHSIEAALRSDTLIYGLLFADKEAYGGGGGFPGLGGGRRGGGGGGRPMEHVDGKKILEQMALETGGGFFEVTKKKSLDQIYAQIDEELRSQYSIGFTPDNGSHYGTFRKISVTTRKKDLVVQARNGYYAD